jgi:hypothetical protein
MKIHDVEQRSDAWYSLRAGMPTASEFSKIVTSNGEPSKSASGYALTLAAELFAGRPVDAWEGNVWTERGREMEAKAIELYEFTRDLDTEPVGFVTDNAGTMGCSPDRFIGNDGLAEVKCLKAENHVKAILRHQKDGSCSPEYIQQTQGQMMICERAWCDLVFYHPELPMLVIRMKPDSDVQHPLMAGIPRLCKERDEVLAALHRQATPMPVENTILAAG